MNSDSWVLSRVLIDDTDPSRDWSYTASTYAWCYGSGTIEDPYIIENITINYQDVGYGGLIEIRNSNVHFIIRSCLLYRTALFGNCIKFIYVTNGKILNNYCSNNNGDGIELEDSDNNIIANNSLSGNEYNGIELDGSDSNEISGNTIINSNYGILVDISSRYNNVTSNYFQGNGRAMWLDSSSSCNFYENVLVSNYGGIYSQDTVYCNIIGNIINGCTYRGISLTSLSLDNVLYGNWFNDNTNNAIDDGQRNLWNCSTYGNYWDDYSGRDANDDGIGDDPYVVPGAAHPTNGMDYLPIWDDGIESPPYFEDPPEDISMVEGDEMMNITWYAKDINKNFDSYWIEQDGILVKNETWDGTSIIYSDLYPLTPATYNFTCFVNDTDNSISLDTVFVEILPDIYPPDITIISPLPNQLCGNNAIEFEILIDDVNLNSSWYILNDGNECLFEGLTGLIDQSEWDVCENGTITIKFYANDTNGNIDYQEVIVRKDTHVPVFTIESPLPLDYFDANSPYFELSIEDPYLDSIWYNINGSSSYCFSNDSGKIDQNLWNEWGNGSILLRFYVNNTAGNMVSEEVLIYKDIIPPNITINLPIALTLYANDPPYFDISISEANLNNTWYTLNDGIINFFTEFSGLINQDAWDFCENGTVSIKFYAQDLANQISYEEITVQKDIVAPIIIVSEPSSSDIFGLSSPTYNFSIQEGNLAAMWYTLNSGESHLINNQSGNIDQTEWDLCSDGPVVIRFYANDSVGNTDHEEIIVVKDSLLPTITINSPMFLQLCGLGAPEFNISINDVDLDASWYTLNDGLINIFSGITGRLNQNAWDMCENGTVKITFYANNSLGHITHSDVVVRKETRVPNITVINPLPLQTFGREIFQYEISIDDPSLDSMWYSLNHGLNYTIDDFIGIISQIAWDACDHGSIELSFYANNSVGNLGLTEVIIYKDLLGPSIIIIKPDQFELFGNFTFDFEISIEDPELNMTWYCLDGGNNYTFSGFTGTIDQTAWDACENGSIALTFFANDSFGNIGLADIVVQKDINLPFLSINLPTSDQSCGPLSPSFQLTLIGNDIDSRWYTLNDEQMHEFTGSMGRIDQQAWDLFGEGPVSIQFYANNSAGNYISAEVSVIKHMDIISKNAYAIVVGISNYPGSSYDLRYCDDDADDVYAMLLNYYNFLPENIIYLKDSSATKTGIDNAFNTINSKIKPDDLFFFYYSGHGGSEIVNTGVSTVYIQSPHPYPNNYYRTWYISSTNAAYIRVHFETLDLEYGYDYLYLGDAEIDDFYYQRFTGYGTNFWSDWIPLLNDNRIYINLDTDYYNDGYYWGFRIDQIEVMRYSDPHYMCSYDSIPSSPSKYYLDTLLDAKLDSLNCDQKYVIVDACNSGGLIPESQDTDRFIMTACRSGQVSYEDYDLQHGVFTYYYLNSLDYANDQNGDGVISMEECFSYTSSGTGSFTGSYGPGYQCQPQLSDGISGQAVLYPSIASVYTNPIDNKLFYSFYLYGHGNLKTLDITVCSIFPTFTFKTEQIKLQHISPTGFGYYEGVIELEEGYIAGGIQIFAEIEGYNLITINITYGDTDGDGLTDFFEIFEGNGLDPMLNDTDGDGLLDGEELNNYNTDPLDEDSDSDGLTDYEEIVIYNSNPLSEDSDSDGLTDYEEIITFGTDPSSSDSDSDGLSDKEEIDTYSTDPLDPDCDSDGLLDGDEIIIYLTNPFNNDTDSDNLSDGQEINMYYTNPLSNDTDSDLLGDYDELMIYNTNPLEEDSDFDGLTDYEEIDDYGTDPLNDDTDSDTMPDGWEVDNSLDPFIDDSSQDPDEDLLVNYQEFEYATDPFNNDTDYDNLIDSVEVFTYNTNPNLDDTDVDGLLDGEEVNLYNTDPLDDDSDSDGLLDGAEVHVYQTDPLNEDTDFDLMPDKWEIDNSLNPLEDDSTLDPDNDDLINMAEYENSTDPQNPDTDGDGWTDGDEILIYNTDPLDPNDHPIIETPPSVPGYNIYLVIGIASIITLVVLKRTKK